MDREQHLTALWPRRPPWVPLDPGPAGPGGIIIPARDKDFVYVYVDDDGFFHFAVVYGFSVRVNWANAYAANATALENCRENWATRI